jgi:hypothetical protein
MAPQREFAHVPRERSSMPKFEDIFEEIGRRLDGEIAHLRNLVSTEVSPAARVKAASVLRRASGALERFAKDLESETAPKTE